MPGRFNADPLQASKSSEFLKDPAFLNSYTKHSATKPTAKPYLGQNDHIVN